MRTLAGLASLMVVLLVVVIAQLYQLSNKAERLATEPVTTSNISNELALIQSDIQEMSEALASLEKASDIETPFPSVDSVGEVFSGGAMSKELNEIKSRYESVFVNYQYLKGCGVASDTDYHIVNSALMHELASNSAPARLQYDILTAAQGTYQEIYARSGCEKENVEKMQNEFKAYVDGASKIGFVIKN